MAALLLLGIFGVASTPLHAQGSPSVALGDPAYVDARRVIDAGLAPGALVGQAPWSRRTFARIALAARRTLLADGPAGAPGDRLDRAASERLMARFAEEVVALERGTPDAGAARPFSEVRVDALATDSPERAIEENGVGSIEADVNPLLDRRAGRTVVPGSNVAVESEHWARLGRRITVAIRPRLWVRDAREAATGGSLSLVTASARAVVGNAAITVGREHTDWGNAVGGGVLFSDNAPALDLVRIASEQPFHLPSLLGRLGPAAATLQVAQLGPSVERSHSLLAAYKVSVQPSPVVELGASFANHFGGAGAVNPTLGRRLVDLVPLIDIFRHHEDSTEFDSDKLLGLDARVRVPRLANVTLFAELALEDFDVHRVRSMLTEDAAWIVGAIVPRALVPGVSAQLAWHATGIRFYEHHTMRNGYAASRQVIGDPLARDASGWYGTVTWEGRDGLSLRADAAVERRGNDRWVGEYTQPGLKGLEFRRVALVPAETRRRLTAEAAMRPLQGSTALALVAGVERVSGPPAADAGTRTHGVAEARFSLFR